MTSITPGGCGDASGDHGPLVLTAVQNFAGTERAGLIDAAAGKREQMSALFALTRLHTPLEKP